MSLNPDQAKITKKDDVLGFASVSESVAKSILDGEYPDGFVIGIEGEWGSGKTTYINFIRESLKEQSPEFKIIEFKPWLHSSHENLIGAYFKVLRENAKDIFGDDSDIKETLGNVISAFAPVGEAIANAISWGLLGKIVNAIMSLCGKELQKKPTLESQYKKIKNHLKDAGKAKECRKSFVVIIDDLDRLDKAEIRTMLKLVKSVGKLPYVTYILAYDRNYVKGATNTEMPNFLEKIVQLPIPLPIPNQNKLFAMMAKELGTFFKDILKENDDRFREIFELLVPHHLKKPRDVVLLANAINFYLPTMKEILDTSDFFAIECLRLFDKELWDWIKDNKEIVMNEFGDTKIQFEEKSAKEQLEKSLLERQPLSPKQITILSILFPRLSNALGRNSKNTAEEDYKVKIRHGIAVSSVYDAYFAQYLEDTEISKAHIDNFLKNSNDREKTTQTLKYWLNKRSARGFSKITEFREFLSYHFMDKESPEPHQTLLWSLIDVLDDVNSLKDPPSMFDTLHKIRSQDIFTTLFKKIGKPATSAFLHDLCKEPTLTSAATSLLHKVGCDSGKIGSSNDNNKTIDLIDDSDWNSLTKALAPCLENAFTTGTVGNFSNVASAEFFTGHIFGNKVASTMFKNAYLKSDKYTIKSIKSRLMESISDSNIRSFVFKPAEKSEIFDFNFMADVAEKIELKNYDDDTKDAVKLFIKGVRTPELLTNDQKSKPHLTKTVQTSRTNPTNR